MAAELPKVRDSTKTGMDFTEKKFAHLPARESQIREAPYPQSKKLDKKKDDVYIDVEDKDPVWLKDKGDHFFKRADYNAACNAYGKALKEDSDFAMARLNRAATFIQMRHFNLAIDDCNDLETQITGLKEEDQKTDGEFYERILVRALLKRAAAYAWSSKFAESVLDFRRLLDTPKYCEVLGRRGVEMAEADLSRVIVR